MKAKLATIVEHGKIYQHVVEFSDDDGHMVSLHFSGQGEVVYSRDNRTQTDYPARAGNPICDSRGRPLQHIADIRVALDALVWPKRSEQSS